MNWLEAMETVVEGSYVVREEWEEGYYVGLHDSRLQLHKTDGRWFDWIVSEEDMLAKDWEVGAWEVGAKGPQPLPLH